MIKVIIISDDICATKQITNTIRKIKNITQIITYKQNNYNPKSKSQKKELQEVYIFDISQSFKELIEKIRKTKTKNPKSNIILLGINPINKIPIIDNFLIDIYIYKNDKLEKQLKKILLSIDKNQTKIKISNSEIPIILDKNEIENIYHFPNNQICISYKNGKNNIWLSQNKTTSEIKKLTEENFYIDKSVIKYQKRTYYSEPLKQLLVDLYTNFNINCKDLEKHFKIDSKYIKKWASLKKYNRKINKIGWYIGKMIIKAYLKK